MKDARSRPPTAGPQPDAAVGRPDLRLAAVGLAAWAGCLLGHARAPVAIAALGAALLAAGCLWSVRTRRPRLPPSVWVGPLVVGIAGLAVASVHVRAHTEGRLAPYAAEGAVARIAGELTSDPRMLDPDEHGTTRVLVRLDASEVLVRGRIIDGRHPVMLIAPAGWETVPLGSSVLLTGRLLTPLDVDVEAAVSVVGPPQMVGAPSLWWRGAAAVREGLHEAVAGGEGAGRALVPALVSGDDSRLPPDTEADFRTAGLTHLLAVSGTNLTIVVGFLLAAARWAGVRGRWLTGVALLGVAGFLLLARGEPSVIRAAAMGVVGLAGLGSNGRQRGTRAWGAAVTGLLLWDPGLAVSAGFALSALATAGILWLAPGWRDALARWLPRWVAEAVAVPLAAQLVVTPLVAGLSGRVSLVAVAANVAAEPVVGLTTVAGLVGGLVFLAVPPLGGLIGRLALWGAEWIVTVAQHAAALPGADTGWPTTPPSLTLLVGLCLIQAILTRPVLARPGRALPVLAATALVVTLGARAPVWLPELPLPGRSDWPPAGWVAVACDVGQGDAVVLNAGPGAAVVIDAGPEPASVDRCLDDLGVTTVPLVVTTHFHADHVDGLAGVVTGRTVGEVWVSGLPEPTTGVAAVTSALAETDGPEGPLRPQRAAYAEWGRVGAVRWQVVGPADTLPGSVSEGSAANNASVVLLVQVRGVSILLTGDVEPEAQRLLARTLPGLDVDVLKVPHHGSRHQDTTFLESLRAEVALLSVGTDNGYGHPAPETVGLLAHAGATVGRTDLDGDLAVVARDGRVLLVRRGR